MIKFIDTAAESAYFKDQFIAKIKKVVDRSDFILGEDVSLFENKFAAFAGSLHAVSCASGTDAIYLALRAVGIKPGQEVVTTPFTFMATASAILRAGAVPVFADITPSGLNIDPASVKTRMNRKTGAILAVHIFGLPADMDGLMELSDKFGVPLIEDCAQSFGSSYGGKPCGSMGKAGCFSFFPTKNLGGAGDGGMVVTGDAGISAAIRVLRAHGKNTKGEFCVDGINSRLDTLQAALLLVKLKEAGKLIKMRRELFALYREELSGLVEFQEPSEGAVPVPNQCVVMTDGRDGLKKHLAERKIMTAVYYDRPLYSHPVFKKRGYRDDCPAASRVCGRVLSLPFYPLLTVKDAEKVISEIKKYFKGRK